MKDERETERLLERFSPKPAPPWLRERTLQAARHEAEARRIMTPAWRWALISSLVLLIFFLLADWRVSSREQNLLSSLLNLPGSKVISPQRAADEEAAELLAYLPDLDPASWRLMRQAFLNEERAAIQSQRSVQRLTEGINEY